MPIELNDSFSYGFATHDASNQSADADALPTYAVYESGGDAAILTGSASKLDDAGTVGLYDVAFEVSAANGFEVGKFYQLRISATVATVAKNKVVNFRVSASSAAVTGANVVVVTVTDGVNPLESATVRFTKGAQTDARSTDANGNAFFSLDDGAWTVSISLSGYSFTPTTLVVSGDATPSYEMSLVVTPPSDPELITGYLHAYDLNGAIEAGVSVTLAVVHTRDSIGVALDEGERTAVSDGAGLVTFANLHADVEYAIKREGSADGGRKFTIPSGSTSPYELGSIYG